MLTKIMAIALAMGITVAPASAATILIFAESGVNAPSAVRITDNGNGTTSSFADIGVTITSIVGPLGPDLPITDARFILNAHSTDFASTVVLGGVDYFTQRFSGTFEVEAPECGTICLEGSFVDLMSGVVGGRALTTSASTPPASAVTFTSDTIPAGDLILPRALAFSKTDLTFPVRVDCSAPQGCTLGSTSGNISATFSAGVPEPSTYAMMLLGFAGLAFAGYRTSRKSVAFAA